MEQVKQVYPEIQELDDEGLRKKTASFGSSAQINKEDQDRLNDIRAQLETEESLETRENLYAQIELLDKSIYERSEKELELIRPEAFAGKGDGQTVGRKQAAGSGHPRSMPLWRKKTSWRSKGERPYGKVMAECGRQSHLVGYGPLRRSAHRRNSPPRKDRRDGHR